MPARFFQGCGSICARSGPLEFARQALRKAVASVLRPGRSDLLARCARWLNNESFRAAVHEALSSSGSRWRQQPQPSRQAPAPSCFERSPAQSRRYGLKVPAPVLPAWPVVNDLLTLPLAERLELVQTLWDSIAAEQSHPELSDADRQLIDQRMEVYLADGDPGLDAEAVLDAIEQSL